MMRAARHAYWTAAARLWRAAESVTAHLSRFCWRRKVRAQEAVVDSMSAVQQAARKRAVEARIAELSQKHSDQT